MDQVFETTIMLAACAAACLFALPWQARRRLIQMATRKSRSRRHLNALRLWQAEMVRGAAIRLAGLDAGTLPEAERFVAERRSQFPEGEEVTALLESATHSVGTLIRTALIGDRERITALADDLKRRHDELADAVSQRADLPPLTADVPHLITLRANEAWLAGEATSLGQERFALRMKQAAACVGVAACIASDAYMLALAQLSDLTDPSGADVTAAWSLAAGLVAALAACVHFGQVARMLSGHQATAETPRAIAIPSGRATDPDGAEHPQRWQRAARAATLPVLAAVVLVRRSGPAGENAPIGTVVAIALGALALAVFAALFVLWAESLKDELRSIGKNVGQADSELRRYLAAESGLGVPQEQRDQCEAEVSRREAAVTAAVDRLRSALLSAVQRRLEDPTTGVHLSDVAYRVAMNEEHLAGSPASTGQPRN